MPRNNKIFKAMLLNSTMWSSKDGQVFMHFAYAPDALARGISFNGPTIPIG